MTTDFTGGTDQEYALALQADGKMVVSGNATTTNGVDFTLARYTANGSLDTAFGTDGKR